MRHWDFVVAGPTRADLIADGDLVEIPWIVSNPAGMKLPVAFSRAAWFAVMDGIGEERWPEVPDALVGTLLVERATRTLKAAVQAVTTGPGRQRHIAFDVPLYGVTLHLRIGPDDNGRPVFTVFMPDEN
ncbi:hypothetical protein ACFY1P_21680 [Streptomyces sp. NPDC001407]|uniref:hypothetical protein n=1 Tax=unclassified Streptomyces TaxID=2593676 RepID=UPI0036B63BC7